VWVEREAALYWVDIQGRKIFRLDEQERLTEWPTPMRVGSLAPRMKGGFIAGTEDGIALVDLDAERFELIVDPEEDQPGNRFNDGKLDRQGRCWAGTMDDEERADSGNALPHRAGPQLDRLRSRLPSHQWAGVQPGRGRSCTITIPRGSSPIVRARCGRHGERARRLPAVSRREKAFPMG